jgi:tRNA(adenine34) deaminase
MEDADYMGLALEAASEAARHGDVPVGCVVVVGGEVVGIGENRREIDGDPTAHAEVVALRRAAATLDRYRLDDATAYVTLEPCVMCAGALLNARVARVVIGAPDEKAGAVGSRYNVLSDPRLLHEAELEWDVRAEESSHLLQDFFAARR